MTRLSIGLVTWLALGLLGCAKDIPRPTSTGGESGSAGASSGGSTGATGGTSGSAGSPGGGGGGSGDAAVTSDLGAVATGGAAGPGDAGPDPGTQGTGGSAGITAEQVKAWAEAYRAAHPGNGGKDHDLNAKSAAQLAGDPAALQLLSVCGPGQRPVIPLLAWEYGGSDHPWINPGASALVYCVYIPAKPSTAHWQYDTATDRVTADVYVRFPAQNPCRERPGKDQVMACLGDPSNVEILVDTASLEDGAGAGLSLSNSSTQLQLILLDGMKVPLYLGL
jgi:hypothetical protein